MHKNRKYLRKSYTPHPTPLNCQKITKEITSERGGRAKAVMADL